MFGETIDYHLLRPLAHSRNRATEEELDHRARHTTATLADARAYLARVRHELFTPDFLVDPDLSYLDVGCGMGRLSVGLADAGATDVTGIDLVPRHIDEAVALSTELAPGHRPRFECIDVHDFDPGRTFDVVVTLGAMEHIRDPRCYLHRLRELLAPGGRAFVSFEPFRSILGDHMHGFFRVPVPWRGVLFNEKAMLRLRQEFYRPTDFATRYGEIAGGLNQVSFTQYEAWMAEAGLRIVRHVANPQLAHKRGAAIEVRLSRVLTATTRLRGAFGVNVYSVIESA